MAGHWSSTRPPWLDTTMAAAPASLAFSAPLTVITPLTMKGLLRMPTISRSSSTLLLPAGGLRFFRKGRPAASTSMATAKQPLSRACSILARMVSMSQGLMVGTPRPPAAAMARVAWVMTLGSVPSPVKAAMPASAQARTSTSLYVMSV